VKGVGRERQVKGEREMEKDKRYNNGKGGWVRSEGR